MTVKVRVIVTNNGPSQILLSDAFGKVLWSKPLDPKLGFTVTGDWQAKSPSLPFAPLASSPAAVGQQTNGKNNDGEELRELGFVIGSDDQPISSELATNKHRSSMYIGSGGLLMDFDGKKYGVQLDKPQTSGIFFVDGSSIHFTKSSVEIRRMKTST